MKKIFMFLAASVVVLGISCQIVSAQEDAAAPEATEEISEAQPVDPFNTVNEEPLHQQLKTKFIEGGAGFMSLVFVCLILGLAVAIERIISLALRKTNTTALLQKVEEALKAGNVNAAIEVCQNTKGPVAELFLKGLAKLQYGIEVVDQEITKEGDIEVSKMESGLSWISLFISIAPSLGFMGTVIGMIQAFDAIQAAGDISPNIVAGGMKVALITTVGGLIVALILQIFYNYIVAQKESLEVEMQEASKELVSIIREYNK